MEIANLGSVGDTIDAFVLHVRKEDMKLMLGPNDSDLVTYIEGLPELVNMLKKKNIFI